MSVRQIQQKMERLKLNHTLPMISELFEQATKQKSSALLRLRQIPHIFPNFQPPNIRE